jgi:glycosyltransferase involved in cell wall biosynthesis
MIVINPEISKTMPDHIYNKSNETFCLNKEFSTTRVVTKEKPLIINRPGDKFQTFLFLQGNQDHITEGGLRTKGYFKSTYKKVINEEGELWWACDTNGNPITTVKLSNCSSQLRSHDYLPLVSVITVVFDGEKYLEETIQSVLGQTYDNLEYIIIDGGSTDSTLDIIRKYDHAIDYWVSEKDKGIYDAMNKGIGLASGDWIGLVNSDDVIYPMLAENVANVTFHNPKAVYTYGKVDLMNEDRNIYGCISPLSKELAFSRRYREMPYPHISIFVSSKIYKKIGVFNTRFQLSADYDFVLRMMQLGLPAARLPKVAGAFRSGGKSGGIRTFVETRHVHRRHGLSLIHREFNFVRSVIKIALVRMFPLPFTSFLKKIFKMRSKHSYS